MNDKAAKICLCIIAVVAIVAAALVASYTTGSVATALIQLAGVCVGALGGVAVQGAVTNNTAVVKSDDDPDVV